MAKSISLPLIVVQEQPVFWTVVSSQLGQRVPQGRNYWYDNLNRSPVQTMLFQLTVEGSIVFRQAHGQWNVDKGQALLYLHNEASSYGRLPGGETYFCDWIALRGAGLLEHWSAIRNRFGSVLDVGDIVRMQQDMRALIHLAGPRSSADSVQIAQAVFDFVMRLADIAQQRLAVHQSPIQRAVQEIMQRPNLGASLKELAHRHHCSREHLTRIFIQRTGRTPGQYLAQARLRNALRLLEETDLPIRAVAEQSGFRTSHTLIRQTTHATGLSPRDYRHSRRNEKITTTKTRRKRAK